MSLIFSAILLFILLAFYLLPWIISMIRGNRHQGAIFVINLFFGWTILGWLAVLIWAAASND